jgi:formate dehydrogenase subunit delta
MSHNSAEKLVKMANQIGMFFRHQKHADPIAAVAEHLTKFWDPRMRAKIVDHVEHGGAGLDALPLDAVKYLVKHAPKKSPETGDVRVADTAGLDA